MKQKPKPSSAIVFNKSAIPIVFNKHDLWMNQAPSWNFELNEDELLAKAIELGFVTAIGDNEYLVNNEY